MNNPNPFLPQGSLLEQNKRRSRMKLGVFCVLAVGICGLTAMLIQGCKRENTEVDNNPPVDTNPPVVADTNPPVTEMSNPPVLPPLPTNPPVVVTPPAPEPATTEYTVVSGDTLGKIAKKFGVSVKALEDANPGIVPTKLKINKKLVIPAATGGTVQTTTTSMTETSGAGEQIYSVKSGDNLTKIAKRFGTTVKAIEAENNLTTTQIKVGQKLKIPASATVAAPVVAPPAVVSAPMTPPPGPAPTN